VIALKFVSLIIFLVIIPLLTGYTACKKLNIKSEFSRIYVTGLLIVLALCEITAVFVILIKQTFTLFIIMYLLLLTAATVYSVIAIKKDGINFNPAHFIQNKITHLINISPLTAFFFVTMIGIIIFTFIASGNIRTENKTWQYDTTEYMLSKESNTYNQMLLYETKTETLTNSITNGKEEYVTSPWFIYPAFLQKVTKISLAGIYRNVLPLFIWILSAICYYTLAHFLFKDKISTCMFVSFIFLTNHCAYESSLLTENYITLYPWNGFTILALFGIPVTMIFYILTYANPNSLYCYLSLLFANLSLALFSNIGLYLSILMAVGFGVTYLIERRKPQLFGIFLSALPNLLLLIINLKLLK